MLLIGQGQELGLVSVFKCSVRDNLRGIPGGLSRGFIRPSGISRIFHWGGRDSTPRKARPKEPSWRPERPRAGWGEIRDRVGQRLASPLAREYGGAL